MEVGLKTAKKERRLLIGPVPFRTSAVEGSHLKLLEAHRLFQVFFCYLRGHFLGFGTSHHA